MSGFFLFRFLVLCNRIFREKELKYRDVREKKLGKNDFKFFGKIFRPKYSGNIGKQSDYCDDDKRNAIYDFFSDFFPPGEFPLPFPLSSRGKIKRCICDWSGRTAFYGFIIFPKVLGFEFESSFFFTNRFVFPSENSWQHLSIQEI